MTIRRRTALLGAIGLCAIGLLGLAQLVPSGTRMTEAGERFVKSLNDQQKGKALLAYEVPSRTDWHYIPKNNRKGLQLSDMDDPQRKAAHELLQSALSTAGYGKATKIMALETLLKELEKSRGGAIVRDPGRYYFTLFGDVGPSGRWGLSVEGHHLSLNFVVDQNKLVSTTPTFFGVNPAELKSDYGPENKKGQRILAKEEDLAYQLLASLSEAQRKSAIIAERAPNDLRGATQASPPLTPAEGLAAADMTPEQRAVLKSLVEEYAFNVPGEVSAERLSAIEREGIGKLTFAWLGSTERGEGHAYRIQGPTFLIELNNTQADSAGNPANHIHSVWHNLAGNFALPADGQSAGTAKQ